MQSPGLFIVSRERGEEKFTSGLVVVVLTDGDTADLSVYCLGQFFHEADDSRIFVRCGTPLDIGLDLTGQIV